ncbi:MAG: aldo/keto reductase [Candidatus Andersenbacteria bacterium]
MTVPTKKLLSGFEIPILGIGTARMIGAKDDEAKSDDSADISAIKMGIEMGINHIDTAELYGDGHAEILIGQAIHGIDRSKLFITSKVHSPHQSYKDVIKSAHGSLMRLGVDYLDLYLIHQPDLVVSIWETMKAMNYLVDKGVTKFIGVSNFNSKRLKEAQLYSDHKIVLDQVHYNLMVREPEKDGLVKFCQENDIVLAAWRPLQKGTFLQKDSLLLEELAKKYNKSVAQIAINWLISQKNIIAISKMRKKEHIIDNLGALNWQMSEEDIERLRIEFPNQKSISDRFPFI